MKIVRTTVRVDQRPALVARHRVDREIAPCEVLFERHLRRRKELEAAISAPVFALGACERVFLARFGMQEHRKIAADRLVARGGHHLRRGTDNDPVAVAVLTTDELVADGAADTVDMKRLPLGAGHRA